MAMSNFSNYSTSLPPSVCKNLPHPISFVSKAKKMDKVDGYDAEKTYEFLMDPDNPA
jgi:hypothetical protein